MRRLALGVAYSLGVSTCFGQATWLEVLPFTPVAMSGNGEVVIGATGQRWTRTGGLEQLPSPLGAPGITYLSDLSFDGAVAVGGVGPFYGAFRWVSGEGSVYLPGNTREALGISRNGTHTVGTFRPEFDSVACRWNGLSYPSSLGTYSTTQSSYGRCIAPDGRAVVYSDIGGVFKVGGLLGDPVAISGPGGAIPLRMSNNRIVGYQTIGTLSWAVIWNYDWYSCSGPGPLVGVGQAPTSAHEITPDSTLVIGAGGWGWSPWFGSQLLRPILEREGIQFPTLDPIEIVDVSDDRHVFVGTGGGLPAWIAKIPQICYANCDASTLAPVLNVADFVCFLQQFAAGYSRANCDESTSVPVLNVADFSCFLQRFAVGCP
jgi:hypothetical protein